MQEKTLLISKRLNKLLDWPVLHFSNTKDLQAEEILPLDNKTLVLDTRGFKESEFTDSLNLITNTYLLVVFGGNTQIQLLQSLIDSTNHVLLVGDLDEQEIYNSLVQLLEKKTLHEQRRNLSRLIKEEKVQLQEANSKLTQLVSEKQLKLKKFKSKADQTALFIETYNQALIRVNQAKSLGAIENSLIDILRTSIGIELVRIIYPQQFDSFIGNLSKRTKNFYTEKIEVRTQLSPTIVFVKDGKTPLRRAEIDLLSDITECIRLSIIRIDHLETSETLKKQWEATFNSIADSICVLDEDLNVRKSNLAYKEFETRLAKSDLNLVQAFSFLMDWRKQLSASTPKQKEHSVHLKGELLTYKVSMHLADSQNYVCILSDISESKRLERRIIDSSRLAELGLIGSSIAHELNNPIGGMLSYLQLIKMDLASQSPFYDDVVTMERATHVAKKS